MSNKLSFSSMNVIQECGEKYRLQYIEKLRPKKQKSSLLFGKAIDAALNVLLETRDIKLAKKVFRHNWREQEINGIKEKLYLSENVKYSKSDLEEFLVPSRKTPVKNPEWWSLLNKGLIILEAYNKEILPRIKRVITVQKEITFPEVQEGDIIRGFIDIIVEWEDGKVYIADNKTTSVKYDEDSANKSEQLGLYYTAMKKHYPELSGVMFIVLNKKVKKKTRTVDTQVILGTPNKKDLLKLFSKFDTVNDTIHNDSYSQNKDACYSKYGKCDYYELCHFGTKKHLIKI